MTWNPTNANDVTLTVSTVTRDSSGANTGSTKIGKSGNISVDEFSIETEEDLTRLSGVGNAEALGISRGDVEHSFSFTVQGEDAELFSNLATDNGRANELQILVKLQDFKFKLTGAYAGTRNVSGSDGDPIEYEVGGIAKSRTDSNINTDSN